MRNKEELILDRISSLARGDQAEQEVKRKIIKVTEREEYLNTPAAKIPLALILPFGSNLAYSTGGDSIIGLKLAGIGRSTAEILSLISELKNLRRLVLYTGKDAELIDEVAELPNLEMVWLGGGVKKISRKIFSRLPVYTEPNTGRIFYDLLGRADNTEGELALEIAEEYKDLEDEEISILRSPVYSEIENDLSSINGLYIGSTPNDPPIEIIRHGRLALERYYLELEKDSLPLNEVKAILVGGGGAGKTSLTKILNEEKFNPREKQTHGINIKKWKPTAAEITVNFWDFGGQEIMHATHQFFLSKRSLYILVLDGRKDEDPEYWLQHIESFGGESPVFVVINKIDENRNHEVNRRHLLKKYPNIVDFFKISCATNEGVEALKIKITEVLPASVMLKTEWPTSWFRIKRELEAKKSDFITLAEYKSICVRHGMNDDPDQDVLVDFLHDLGIVLHFKEIKLLDTHVLNPHWVTDGVYKIINSPVVSKNNGVLDVGSLDAILKPAKSKGKKGFEHPKEKHAFLVDMMLKFQLGYPISDSKILIPDLLDIQEPEIVDAQEEPICFILQYSYLPKSIILRTIVRLHKDIKDNLCWRTGLVIEDPTFKARAIIKADDKESVIKIHVTGEQKRDLFAVIRKCIWDINSGFEKLDVTELVPLPDHPQILVDYKNLIGHEKGKRDEIFIGELGKSYSVQALLNGIEPPERRVANRTIMVQGDYYEGSQVLHSENQQGEIVINKPSSKTIDYEKIAAYIAAAVILIIASIVILRNEPFNDPNIVVLLRAITGLMVATLGATIPGLLKVLISTNGLKVRAVGALALFIITYMYTPNIIPIEKANPAIQANE